MTKIETEKAFSSVLLAQAAESLAAPDRALSHELVLGVLRRQMFLDRIIEKLSNGKKIDVTVKIILRLGVYQLLFLDKIPAHAAINEAVNLAQQAKKTSAKSFVNAVLRRLTREKVELNYADEVEKIAVETSHPRWLIEKWIDGFGLPETAALAAANNRTPQLSYRWTAKTTEAVKQSLARANVENLGAYLHELAAAGKIYFQDAGSQAVGRAVEIKAGDKFLDVCAAPGSKTTQLADPGFAGENLFVAGDLHFSRVRVLMENCRRQGADFVKIVQYDAAQALPFADESFDVALVDAPCTGTGTIRHNPEIRYFLEEKNFAEISRKQLGILNEASKLIKQGGKLIYSTCSLENEENEEVAGKFLAENRGFEKIAPALPAHLITPEKFARTFPQKDEMDGFFIAVFEKK